VILTDTTKQRRLRGTDAADASGRDDDAIMKFKPSHVGLVADVGHVLDMRERVLARRDVLVDGHVDAPGPLLKRVRVIDCGVELVRARLNPLP